MSSVSTGSQMEEALCPLNRQIGIGSNSSYGLSNQPLSGRNEKRSKRTGGGVTHAGQSRTAFAGGIAYPDTDGVARG